MNVSGRKATSLLSILALAAGLGTLSPAAHSQDSGNPVLEEIVVTAQRREQNLQLVPITVTTLSGAVAEARGAHDINSLQSAVPNLMMTTSAFTTGTWIRGIGNATASYNTEPSAAAYVDGVYMPSSWTLNAFEFNNIQRIEVLKGPQGTLFGRDTTAGVIQIITPDPQQDPLARLSVGYANYDEIEAGAYVAGGFSESVSADLAVFYEDQREGWGRNLTLGIDAFLYDQFAVRSKWLFTPSDATQIRLSVDASEYDSDGTNQQFAPGSPGPDGMSEYPGRHNYLGNHQWDIHKESVGAAVTIDHDFTALYLKSITSWRNVSGSFLIDDDYTANISAVFTSESDADYFTQEFHLGNRNPDEIEWLVGAFWYSNQVCAFCPRADADLDVAPLDTPQAISWGNQDTRSASLFGQATFGIASATNLTLGVRYTDEKAELSGWRQLLLDPATGTYESLGPYSDEVSYDPWTWRIALDHQFSSDVLGFISFNRGFKSGGYNLGNPAAPPFFPEYLDSYEVGLKTEFLDNRVRLNAAVFYYDYTDMQIQVSPALGQAPSFENAGESRIYGADVDLDFVATENLAISAGLGLLDAEFRVYDGVRSFDALGNQEFIPSAKGNDLPNSPPVSGFVGFDYRVPVSFGDFRVTANATYQAKSYPTPANEFERPEYTLLTAALEWNLENGIGVRLWGRNLLDESWFVFMQQGGNGWYWSEGEPQRYGLTLIANF